jgi:luciferase-type oxidoreductase
VFEVNSSAPIESGNGFKRMFVENKLSLGIFFPLESFESDIPEMKDQERLAKLTEKLGYAALWFRDVPLRDPSFNDVGQIFDVWVYLSWIAAQTSTIGLATGSVILPIRHPIHTAKAAASIDQLSNGRLVLGVASGDRPVEFPAFNINIETRGEKFKDHFSVMKQALEESFPHIQSQSSILEGLADTIPKAVGKLPFLVTGNSQQSLAWIAANADGWITYPRPINQQANIIKQWHEELKKHANQEFKPFAQSFYIDLSENSDEAPTPIHLGFRSGTKALIDFLEQCQLVGVNHVALNLKIGKRPAEEVIAEIGETVLPNFRISN